MVKGVIFDLDGTIIDSMFIWDSFGVDCLKLFDIEPNKNLTEVFKTFTIEQAAEFYHAHYDIKLSIKEITQRINKMLVEKYRTEVILKPGIADFLKRLKNSGIKMCVATVTDRTVAEEVLKRLNILHYFSEIITCADVGRNKETPEIYRCALKLLGTKKEETVVFEDAFHALKTAKEDGFPVAGVYDLYESRQKELKEISDYYITDFGRFCFKTKMRTSLSIAGSDSSGGAGIQADIKTMTMNGVYGMSAVTALTAQNTLGVRSILESTPEFLKEQLDSVFEDIFPDSVKIGMVSSGALKDVIADRLRFYNARNVVVDPVMITTSGSALIKTSAIKSLVSKLLPIATLVTPNIPEAEVLADMKINCRDDMIKAAQFIENNYGCKVLLKGGHCINDANDLLYQNGGYIWFEGKRIDNPNTHGTGCTLSSAVAANLAKGFSVCEAVRRAKQYITDILASGLDLGMGSGPLMHNFGLNITYPEEN